MTTYEDGFRSVQGSRWPVETIRLHLGWLVVQLRINPADEARWGRHDALCDILARETA